MDCFGYSGPCESHGAVLESHLLVCLRLHWNRHSTRQRNLRAKHGLPSTQRLLRPVDWSCLHSSVRWFWPCSWKFDGQSKQKAGSFGGCHVSSCNYGPHWIRELLRRPSFDESGSRHGEFGLKSILLLLDHRLLSSRQESNSELHHPLRPIHRIGPEFYKHTAYSEVWLEIDLRDHGPYFSRLCCQHIPVRQGARKRPFLV